MRELALAVRWLINIQQHFCRYRCEKVLTGLGVPDELAFAIFTEEADLNYNAIINQLDTFIADRPPLALDKNIQVFGTMIGLTPIEIAVFRFVLIARTWVGIFNDVRNARYYSSSNDTYEILANCIGADLYDVELALHDKSPLALCGLVKQERGHMLFYRPLEKVISPDFAEFFCSCISMTLNSYIELMKRVPMEAVEQGKVVDLLIKNLFVEALASIVWKVGTHCMGNDVPSFFC